jgi:hypothetical protein
MASGLLQMGLDVLLAEVVDRFRRVVDDPGVKVFGDGNSHNDLYPFETGEGLYVMMRIV